MVTRRDYTAEAVEACKAVLVELIHLMGELRDHLVVVGGWVPGLLLPNAQEPHVGTTDIDLALDFRNISDDTYQTLLQALTARGYGQDAQQPFKFYRDVPMPGPKTLTVEVDLLAGEYGGTGAGRRTQPVQDVRARKARGCDLAFTDPIRVSLEANLPGGGRDRVTFQVARIAPWLVMKGMALEDRLKEKDAYDIYYVVRYYPGSAARLADAFRPHLGNRLVREGLGKIRSKFMSVKHVGAKLIADFLEITDPEERAITQRRAYEMITAWLDALEVAPWREG